MRRGLWISASLLGRIVLDFPSAYAKDPNEYMEKGQAMFDQYKNVDNVRV